MFPILWGLLQSIVFTVFSNAGGVGLSFNLVIFQIPAVHFQGCIPLNIPSIFYPHHFDLGTSTEDWLVGFWWCKFLISQYTPENSHGTWTSLFCEKGNHLNQTTIFVGFQSTNFQGCNLANPSVSVFQRGGKIFNCFLDTEFKHESWRCYQQKTDNGHLPNVKGKPSLAHCLRDLYYIYIPCGEINSSSSFGENDVLVLHNIKSIFKKCPLCQYDV